MRKLKILCLHSFRTSGAIFEEQLRRAGLLASLQELVELVFIDAPNPASGPIPEDVAAFFKPPFFEWWNANRNPDGTWSYDNADASLALLEDVFRLHGPFDGLMGFSQGGALAALVAGMQRGGKALSGQPPLRFVICFAGIRVRDPRLERHYAAMRPVHSLHVLGEKDPVKVMTNHLISGFDKPVVIHHAGGHVIPSLPPPELARFKAFLETHSTESAM